MPMHYRLASDVAEAWHDFCQDVQLEEATFPPPPSAFLSYFQQRHVTGGQELRDKYNLLNTGLWEGYGVCLGQWDPQIAFYVYHGYAYDESLPPKVFEVEEINRFCDAVDLNDPGVLTRAAVVVSQLCGAPGDADQLRRIDFRGSY